MSEYTMEIVVPKRQWKSDLNNVIRVYDALVITMKI